MKRAMCRDRCTGVQGYRGTDKRVDGLSATVSTPGRTRVAML